LSNQYFFQTFAKKRQLVSITPCCNAMEGGGMPKLEKNRHSRYHMPVEEPPQASYLISMEIEGTEGSGQALTDQAGHRARLRGRILQDPESLADYELIEYLLALAIPRRDTKPLAKLLLREFGSYAQLLSAQPESLLRVKGMGETAAAAIKIAQISSIAMLKGKFRNQPILSSWDAVLDWLRAEMGPKDREQVRILFLNSRNMLLRDEVMSEGSVDQSAVYVREVIRRALELSAAAFIIVHNHPSGNPEPSRQDINITKDLFDSAKKLGISLHDHIIIGGNDYRSLRSMGLL
jgi:DNA repair protein RadC